MKHNVQSALEILISTASKLKSELTTDLQMKSIPLKELSSLAENIHVKTREASQNTDLDMCEFLGIDKALQSMQGELLNNASKLTEINKRIQRDTKKLKEIKNEPIYTDEQRVIQGQIRRLEYQKRDRDIVTLSIRSSGTSCKDQANH